MTEIKFDDLKEPTMVEAKAVYDALKDKSVRKFATQMTQLGWKFSISTAQRWIAAGFIEKVKPSPEVSNAQKASKRLKNAVQSLGETNAMKVAPELQQIKDIMDGKVEALPPEHVTLMANTASFLEDEFKKRLLVSGIILMDTVVKRRDLLVLTPKDVGSFVESMSVVPTNLKILDNQVSNSGDDAKTIEGSANVLPMKPPPNMVSERIALFRKENGL